MSEPPSRPRSRSTGSAPPFRRRSDGDEREGVGCVKTVSLQTGQIRTVDEFTHPTGLPLSRFSRAELHRLVIERGF
jgi:hypothetical protein